MKTRFILSLITLFTISLCSMQAQSTPEKHATNEVKLEPKEDAQLKRKIEKAKKATAKAEKAQKVAEKKLRKKEKLAQAITARQKSIRQAESKVERLEDKLVKNKRKGKLSEVDEDKMNQKIDKLKTKMIRDKEKLAKLRRKQ